MGGEFLRLVGAQKERYFNILLVEILIWEQNNFPRVISEPKNPFKGSNRQN